MLPSANNPVPFNTEQLVKAAKYMFMQYCREARVIPDDVPRLNPGHFVKWLREADNPNTTPGLHPLSDNVAAFAREIEVPVEAVEFVIRLGTSSTGLAHLSGLWPYLVLAGRSTEHEIRSVQLMFILQWTDGTVCPLIRISHKDTNPSPITDAEVVHFISSQGSQFAAHLLAGSCDALYDGHQQFKGLGDRDVLTKIMLSAEDAFKNGRIVQADMDKIGKLVSFMGSMFPDKLPPRVQKEFDLTKQGTASQPKADNRGGWDD
jgi:hypothetical protein